ncbi:hypothetical protein NP233_g8667 [Leucocoprinus birnbaumii]|uniref:HAD-like protein n=1 Tax=Leucocoprinus birnbaumii TaxID=56174 RepID=A0AAD5YMX4_9AGAR|nr:hypothetical protein NP233_g8667 [Leucocoprinus birnbaumii]
MRAFASLPSRSSNPLPTHRALILDLGDVVFNWKAPTDGKLCPKVLARAMSTLPWHELECGRITETECFERIGELMGIPPSDIGDTIRKTEVSLTTDDRLLSVLKGLKDASNGTLKIYVMSNISKPHWDIVRSQPWDGSIFDQIFTSGELGMRKPNLNFYQHVLKEIGLERSPEDVIFVDDKRENVFSALSLGMVGIRFEDNNMITQQLLNILGDPTARGEEFLHENAKNMHCTTDNGDLVKENFAQLLILEATGNMELVTLNSYPLLWNFFQEQPVLTTSSYPNDFDTTSIAFTVLGCSDSAANDVMDMAAKNLSSDGIIQLYDDPLRPRVDPVSCVHILTLFYQHGRGDEVKKTYEWVYQILLYRAYSDGTLYYCAPDYFFYALSRLITYTQQAGSRLAYPVMLLQLQCV